MSYPPLEPSALHISFDVIRIEEELLDTNLVQLVVDYPFCIGGSRCILSILANFSNSLLPSNSALSIIGLRQHLGHWCNMPLTFITLRFLHSSDVN